MIYLISRTDHVDYDEYDAVVVKAKNRKEAVNLARELKYFPINVKNMRILAIRSKGKSDIILGSFNAG